MAADHVHRLLGVVLITGCLLVPPAASPGARPAGCEVRYGFDVDAEGWTGDPLEGNIEYTPDEGGHIVNQAGFTFIAPNEFLRSVAQAFGGTLSLDYRGSDVDVVLGDGPFGADGTRFIQAGSGGDLAWRHLIVPLDSSSNRWVYWGDGDGRRASDADIRSVLSSLKSLAIVARAGTHLDNVVLEGAEEPRIVVSPRALRFPRVRARGNHLFRKLVTIRNVGRCAAEGEIALIDTSNQFLLPIDPSGTPVPFSVPPREQLSFEVHFVPNVVGRHEAVLQVTNPSSSQHPEILIPITGKAF